MVEKKSIFLSPGSYVFLKGKEEVKSLTDKIKFPVPISHELYPFVINDAIKLNLGKKVRVIYSRSGYFYATGINDKPMTINNLLLDVDRTQELGKQTD